LSNSLTSSIKIKLRTCFSIENKGEYSRPFKSSYGWHIVQLIDKKGVDSYEEMKPELQQKINSGGRSSARTDRYVTKLKSEYGFNEYPGEMAAVYAAVDSTILTGNWQADQLKGSGATLFSIGTLDISTGEFALYLESNQNKGKANNPAAYADMLYQSYVNERIMQYEEDRLPEKFPEFAWVYEEYHDGILLFDIMDQKVWSMAVADSSGLEAFHKAHKKDYMWEKRTEACLVKCTGDVDVQGIRDSYKKIVKKKLDEASLNANYCSNDTIPCISITPLLLEKGENEELDALNGVPGPGPITEMDGSSSFIIVKGTRQAEPKKLDEARGQITSDYQEYLEAEWINSLKEKFPVSVDHSLLTKIKS
jgi:peptidyl-prolyl cis-trans isomerase SurA